MSIKQFRKRLASAAVLAASLLLFNQCADNPLAPDVQGDNEVWIQSDGFHPRTLTVAVNTTVEWTNKDNEAHTVDSGLPKNPTTEFTSPTLKPENSWSRKFSKKGSFDYYCSIHQRTGKIVVQ